MTEDTTPTDPKLDELLADIPEEWDVSVKNYPCDEPEIDVRLIPFGPTGNTVRLLAEFEMDKGGLRITVGNGPSEKVPDPEGTPLELIAELFEYCAEMIRSGIAEHDPSAPDDEEPAAPITDHGFVGVAGHSDDNECTHRADGTDLTYCGAERDEHKDRGEE